VRLFPERAGRRVRLSAYERECGRRLDAWFAAFNGSEPDRETAVVFGLFAHQLRLRGDAARTRNPFGVEGAGWAGFTGFATPVTRLATFETLDDGCRAAAVVLHETSCAAVRTAYLRHDPLALAAALEAHFVGTMPSLAGLARATALIQRKPALAVLVGRVRRPAPPSFSAPSR
jgi:hypothetical protein